MRTTIRKSTPSLLEVGSTGLKEYGGIISEETLRQLAGLKGVRVFAEMRDNDPTIGAILFIIDKLLRNVPWRTEPANETPAAKEIAEFVESCRHDMEHSWEDFISEVLSMLPFGWSAHEKVYKIRKGVDTTDQRYYSVYDDGRVGWRKLPIRAQETVYRWEMNDVGDVIGMEQLPYKGPNVTIPAKKLLLFKTQSYKNNPQGRSILRNAYRPWFFKKHIEEIEGIGIERDLAGLPVVWVPSNLLDATASAQEKATLSKFRKMVTNVRRDVQEGIVMPLVYDENNNKMYDFSLLSTSGQRQFDTSKIIDRYDKRIAMTVLADFIFLGQSKVGSFALSSDKTDMFAAALGAWLKDIAAVLNRDAIPDLMKLNNIPRELWPKLVPGDIEKPNVSEFCDNVYKLVGVGALIPDDTVNEKIRSMLEIPANGEDGSVITPLDMIEEKLKNDREAAKNKINPMQVVPPNGKKDPGIAKRKR